MVFLPMEPLVSFMSFQMALFSFVGIEMIGVTAGETKDEKQYLKL